MVSLARFDPSCSVYGRGDLAGQARSVGADGDGIGSPGRTTKRGLTETLPTTASIIDEIPAARPRLLNAARPRRRCLRHLSWRHANMDDAFFMLTLWFLLVAPQATKSRL
jgi:hypothetical protein